MGCASSVAIKPSEPSASPIEEKATGGNIYESDLRCSHPRCQQKRVIEPKGVNLKSNFHGSIFCAKHHIERFKRLYKDPTLDHFLKFAISPGPATSPDDDLNPRGELDWTVYSDFLASQSKPHVMSAYVAISKFRQQPVSNRLSRAKQIYDKFIRQGAQFQAVYLEPSEVLRIQADLSRASSDSDVTVDIFLSVESQIIEEVEDRFEAFLQSPVYIRHLKSFSLPEPVAQSLAEGYRASLLEEKEFFKKRVVRFQLPSDNKDGGGAGARDRSDYSGISQATDDEEAEVQNINPVTHYNFNVTLGRLQ